MQGNLNVARIRVRVWMRDESSVGSIHAFQHTTLQFATSHRTSNDLNKVEVFNAIFGASVQSQFWIFGGLNERSMCIFVFFGWDVWADFSVKSCPTYCGPSLLARFFSSVIQTIITLFGRPNHFYHFPVWVVWFVSFQSDDPISKQYTGQQWCCRLVLLLLYVYIYSAFLRFTNFIIWISIEIIIIIVICPTSDHGGAPFSMTFSSSVKGEIIMLRVTAWPSSHR